MISKNSWQNSLFDSVSPQSPWSQEPCLCSQHCTHSGQSIITCYSVRQRLWRLGCGSNTIPAVISTLFYIEMELISARVPRSKGETLAKLKDTGQESCAWSSPKALQLLRGCMTLNLQPGAPKAHQKEVDRTHISLTKGKSSETLTAVTCAMPLCLSALVQRQTGPAQWFSNFFSLAVELFHYATCFVDA